MENAILEQIRAELSALKERVAEMERQLDEYERLEAEEVASEQAVAAAQEALTSETVQAEAVPEAEEDLPADDGISAPEMEAAVAEPEPVAEAAPEDETVTPEPEQTVEAAPEVETAPEFEPEPEVENTPAFEPAPEMESTPAFEPEPEEYSGEQSLEDPILTSPADDAPIDLGIDLPDFGGGVKSINDVQSRKIHKRLMDSASSTPKWKTDLPGTPVRNIISAISLNDRVLMINKLFGEDPQLFQQTLSDLNAMGSFADAEDYIHAHFGDWKMDSEPVYRFMMAVRRKLNS